MISDDSLIFFVPEFQELKSVYGNGFPLNLKKIQYKGIQDIANEYGIVFTVETQHMDLTSLNFLPSK